MTHPSVAPGGWKLDYVVFPGSPGEIAVGVLRKEELVLGSEPDAEDRVITRRMLSLRWCEGNDNIATWQDGAHEWFVIPFTFAAAIARSLLQMKATGFQGLDQEGLQKLIEWMTDNQAVDDCICY